ncbi:MAG: flagellar filament capping protein FliD [Sideroxydans sp.]|nr:flagellar filament capping protein FliD [Sideroxydans sp.]
MASSSTTAIAATSATTSSIDVASIVSQLMAVESQPLVLMNKQIASYQAKISAIGTVQGALSSFQSAVQGLSTPSQFKSLTATSSDTTVLSASASTTAAAGSYTLSVANLAQAQNLAAAGQASTTAAVGSGSSTTLTFDFGSITGGTLAGGTYTGATFTSNGAGTKSVTIDSTNNSLTGIRDAINATNIGVTASIVNDGSASPYRLVLSSATTGANNSMKITVAGDAALSSLLSQDPAGTQNMSETITAKDAQFTVNGMSISKSSNTVSDVIQGVTLNLKNVSTGPVSLAVTNNTAAITTAVNSFVKSFNDLAGTVKSVSSYDATNNTGGVLLGDASTNMIMSHLRNALNTPISNNTGAFSSLSQIGITFQADGTLALDSTKLNQAMSSNFGDIANLFAAVGKSSDSLVSYSYAGSSTKPGTYGVNVTQLAAQGSTTGSAAAASTTITAGSNDALNLTVDGTATSVTLSAGTYTAATLASELQSKINSALSSNSLSVAVTQNAGVFTITSASYGSTSSVAVTGGNGLSNLLGTPTQAAGKDVAGTINGMAATGQGQLLTSSAGDSTGLSIVVLGGSTGSRGTVSYSQGYAYTLNDFANSLLGSTGPLTSETDGFNTSIKDINSRITALNARIAADQVALTTQYSSLDAMLGTMNQLSTYLTQQLARLP